MHHPFAKIRSSATLLYWAATEPIGGVSDSIPVHPENKRPSFEQRQHNNNRRKPIPDKSSENSNKNHPDSDHQVDEYA